MRKMSEEHLSKSEIFADKAVFRSTYIPEQLPHRKEQIASLTDILSTALEEKAPSNILIYGKTGTGKTATVLYVSKQLEEMARTCNCIFVYINGGLFFTQYRVFTYLARVFNKHVPLFGWSKDIVYSELKKRIDTEDRYVVVILDEIDKLATRGDETLYSLLGINDDLNKARVSVIAITNDLTFTELLDQRVKSSVGLKEMMFPPYSADQLKDILTERAVMAFNDSVLDDEVIPLCVALTSKQDGDAKRALDLLFMAGETAERSESKKVRAEHVRIANEKIEANSMVEVVKTLPLQSLILLSSLLMLTREKSEKCFISGEVYNMYQRLCNLVGLEILTERRVAGLISELDFLGLINAVVVSRGRYGRTKEISLNVPKELIQPLLFTEQELKALSNIRVET